MISCGYFVAFKYNIKNESEVSALINVNGSSISLTGKLH